MKRNSNFDVNTPLQHYSGSSSGSNYSATTMDSDVRYASETEDDELDGEDLGGEEVEPKIEEIEEGSMADVKPSSLSNVVEGQVNATPRRGRGRPRKNPVNTQISPTKLGTKGRSKTGCITCRKRKKKCGEEKPTCKLPFHVDWVGSYRMP